MGMTPRARPYNAELPCTKSVQGSFLFLPRGGTGTPARAHAHTRGRRGVCALTRGRRGVCTHIRAAAGAYAHSRAAAGQLVEQAIHVGI